MKQFQIWMLQTSKNIETDVETDATYEMEQCIECNICRNNLLYLKVKWTHLQYRKLLFSSRLLWYD